MSNPTEPYLDNDDVRAEREFWDTWQGESNCLGTVAKVVALCVVVVGALTGWWA